MTKKNILFICKHNLFRSKTAEIYFKKINKNKNVKASSAGFIKGDWLNKLDKKIINIEREVLGEKKINITSGSRPLSTNLIRKQDLIIIISDDLPNIFTEGYLKKNLEVRIWKIKDTDSKDYSEKNITGIIDSIVKKVDSLVKELK